MPIELDPVDRITADALGSPGERAFYLQARKGAHLLTVLVEKQQVQLLAASILEILARVGKETGQGAPEEQMSLEEPILPEWRAGRLSIGYQDERDLVVLEVEELIPEEEEGEDEEEEDSEVASEDLPGDDAEEHEPERIRFWATREQMLSLARHSAAVCASGRPRCPLCGNPMDAEGHRCPALNGHRKTSGQ